MQTLTYSVGKWQAEAQLEELQAGKLMAVISVKDGGAQAQPSSRHTVVFDHAEGADKQTETEMLVRRLLHDRYGI